MFRAGYEEGEVTVLFEAEGIEAEIVTLYIKEENSRYDSIKD